MVSTFKRRVQYALLATTAIAVGLIVHFHGSVLPPAARDMLGDALWAVMIYWLAGAMLPRTRLSTRAIISLTVCFLVEFSQLAHTSPLDAFRATIIGHLVLGSGFDPRDLLAYTVGIVIGVTLDRQLFARRRHIAGA